MSTTITRVYETAKQAEDAAALLIKRKYAPGDMDVIGKDCPDAYAAFRARGVPAASAKIFAGHVAEGRVAVVVRPPMGETFRVTSFLDAFKPIALPDVETDHASVDTTFCSDLLGIPLLVKDDKSLTTLLPDMTVSEMFGIPTTLNMKPMAGLFHGTIGSKLGLPEIIKK